MQIVLCFMQKHFPKAEPNTALFAMILSRKHLRLDSSAMQYPKSAWLVERWVFYQF